MILAGAVTPAQAGLQPVSDTVQTGRVRPLPHCATGVRPPKRALPVGKLTWLALGDDHEDPSRGGEQAIALGRL